MILNNLFLFILLDFCTPSVSPFLNSRRVSKQHRTLTIVDWSIWNGKKCPLLTARCVYVLTLLLFEDNVTTSDRSIRLSMGINSKTIVFTFCCLTIDQSTDAVENLKRKERNTSWCRLDAIFNGWVERQSDLFTAECQFAHCGAH